MYCHSCKCETDMKRVENQEVVIVYDKATEKIRLVLVPVETYSCPKCGKTWIWARGERKLLRIEEATAGFSGFIQSQLHLTDAGG